MHRRHLLTAPRAVFLLFGLSLGGLALACGPSAASVPTPTATDPFAVVRATSQAAYQSGKTLLDNGDVLRGCPLIDTAKTNDPDDRPEIQSALQTCLTAIAAGFPTESPVAVASPRSSAIATL